MHTTHVASVNGNIGFNLMIANNSCFTARWDVEYGVPPFHTCFSVYSRCALEEQQWRWQYISLWHGPCGAQQTTVLLQEPSTKFLRRKSGGPRAGNSPACGMAAPEPSAPLTERRHLSATTGPYGKAYLRAQITIKWHTDVRLGA
jgi:hypothetical protein